MLQSKEVTNDIHQEKSGELVEDSVTEKNSATAEKISVVHQEGIIHLTI